MSANNHEELIKETQEQAIDPRAKGGKIKEALVNAKGRVTAAFETGSEKIKLVPQIITDKMQNVADAQIWQDILEKLGLAKQQEVEMGKA